MTREGNASTAGTLAYLAGPDASFVTGHTLAGSGGLSMW